MQLTFADAEGLGQRKRTRKQIFLAEMEQVVPWSAIVKLIEPHYPKMARPGRQPYAVATLLRIHFLQQWYALSDPSMEEAMYDTAVLRRFARLSGLDNIPDENTILNFRRLPGAPRGVHDGERGLRDAGAQAAARPGGHDQRRQRLHLCGQARGTSAGAGRVPDRGEAVDATAMKNMRERKYAECWVRFKDSARAKVERPFRVVKRHFGYTKVRYRGLAKNAAQALTLFALSTLWMARRRSLLPAG